MAITISPASANDTKPIIRLNKLVFPLMYSIRFDGPLKESTVDALAEHRIQKHFKEDQNAEGQEASQKRSFAFKAVDDSTGQIVGEARWMIYYEDEVLTNTIEDEVENQITPVMPQMQVQAASVVARFMATAKREVLAVRSSETDSDTSIKLRKRVYLAVLAIHPDYQRKGIGRRLLQWGLDEADKLGLITFLEASTDGVRLYEQTGFEKIKDISMDLTPFGGEGQLSLRLMIRQPRSRV